MSGKKARAARREARAAEEVRPARRRPSPLSAVGFVALAAIVSASFFLPDAFDSRRSTGSQVGASAGSQPGEGLPPGSPVPSFAERDVTTDEPITSASVSRRGTLLFFSEGVMCQACFQQIKRLEQVGAKLRLRGIRLVSVTPDSPGELRQAVSQYGITTPMIADDDRDMSRAFNTLGKGMHGDTPGHAFVLVRRGKVLWYRDYWLPPSRSMYVDPATLLADIPTDASSPS